MITREELRQLAQIESSQASAISFYFQPTTPQDKSHREEAILAKDMVREALRQAERGSNHAALREDLTRILGIAESLHGNHSRGKVILACRHQNIWHEMDVPARVGRSMLKVNSRFHLGPLVMANACCSNTGVIVADREKARMFELRDESVSEKLEVEFGRLPNQGRSDGFMGYDAGHRERHKEKEVMVHFKQLAESIHLLMQIEKLDSFVIGCRDETWPDIEPQLNNGLKQKMLARFTMNPATASAEEVKSTVTGILQEKQRREHAELVREIVGQAQRKATGAVGLKHVITALERQEVRTLLISPDFHAEAVECTNCRHLDTRMVKTCAVCGQNTRVLDDVADALIDAGLRNGADVRFVNDEPELDKAGRVGALLRFRADQNTPQKIAV